MRSVLALVVTVTISACNDSAGPLPPTLESFAHDSVPAGTEFIVAYWHMGTGWVLPPPVSSRSVTFLDAVACCHANTPAPPSTIFYFRAASPGTAVITLQEVFGADSTNGARIVDTVHVY